MRPIAPSRCALIISSEPFFPMRLVEIHRRKLFRQVKIFPACHKFPLEAKKDEGL
jgi:hypothetical protein